MVVQACCGKHAYTARASLQAVVPREAKFHIESRVGRLIETRLEWLGSASDVLAIERALGQAFVQAGPNPIICSDWRGIDVFPPGALRLRRCPDGPSTRLRGTPYGSLAVVLQPEWSPDYGPAA